MILLAQDKVTNDTFTKFNSVIFPGNKALSTGVNPNTITPRGLISYLLPYLLTFAGLILFIMLLWGGFEMLTGAANPKSQEAGKQRMTTAIIGFLILFSAYWLGRIVEAVLGISILG